MINNADSIDRKIEKLPISIVNRNLAQVSFAAADASVDRIVRALIWIRSFFARYATRRSVRLGCIRVRLSVSCAPTS